MRAVIAGSSGLVGSTLLQKLLNDSFFNEVIAIARKPLNISHPKLKVVLVTNIENLELATPELIGDCYFCCLGTTIKKAGSQENFKKIDFQAVLDFALIAKNHEAQYFALISASGANPQSSIFYNRIKGETEKSIIDLDLNALVIFRPGLLMGERSEKRFGEKMAMTFVKTISPVLPKTLEKSISTEVHQLADHMIKQSKDVKNKLLIIEARDI